MIGASRADLPPLLERCDGTAVESADQWAERRAEIAELMTGYFVGTFPKETPALEKAEILDEQHPDDGSTRRRVKLTFATPNHAAFEMWVWIPKGAGPFPVLLAAPRYYHLDWAEAALRRGYLVGLYPGVDHMHHEDAYPGYETVWETFRAEYPDATWTEISTKGWLAGRALDYLFDSGSGYAVAEGQVGVIGWSRYGKQSMIAAAFDDRITSVVAYSPGSPAACPYRFTSRNTFAEAPADFPGEWFLPSLREYTGREHELPIDAHGWLGLIAPRRCLIHTAYHDGCEPTFAVEQAYAEGQKVYTLLGHPENLRIKYRDGDHETRTDEHIDQTIDWLDLSFARGDARQEDFAEAFIHRFDWERWETDQTMVELRIPNESIKAFGPRMAILWSLGYGQTPIEWDGTYTFLSEAESKMMTHDRWAVENTARITVSFGKNVRGNIYYNPTVTTPAPAVIWLHPYCYHSGYNEGYGVEDTTVYHRLAQHGYVVLAYDQCGFGLRLLEGRDFYDTYSDWSILGRMVHDAVAAYEFLVHGKGEAATTMPNIDRRRVALLGYSMGGMVALYAAALDESIPAVASFCGFTPMRTDTDAKSTGGIRRLWEWYALQPKLGLFNGHEADIPFDYDDILRLIAPRPCLIVSPTRDRDADFDDVKACVERAGNAWTKSKRPSGLTHLTPDDTNRFQKAQHELFIQWFDTLRQEPEEE